MYVQKEWQWARNKWPLCFNRHGLFVSKHGLAFPLCPCLFLFLLLLLVLLSIIAMDAVMTLLWSVLNELLYSRFLSSSVDGSYSKRNRQMYGCVCVLIVVFWICVKTYFHILTDMYYVYSNCVCVSVCACVCVRARTHMISSQCTRPTLFIMLILLVACVTGDK